MEHKPLVSRSSKSKLSKQAEVVEEQPSPSNPNIKWKTLVRGDALCGDDDTRLNLTALKNARAYGSSAGSSLSRDSSNEIYRDGSGVDLEEFIIKTLHKNAKDRQMILHLEQELRAFVDDEGKQAHKFPQMSSYNRMLVHRLSAFFGLDHNVDQTGAAVVVTKAPGTRKPEREFKDYIRNDIYTDDCRQPRQVYSYEQPSSVPRLLTVSLGPGCMEEVRKARSFEQYESDQLRGHMESRPHHGTGSSLEISKITGVRQPAMTLKRVIAGNADPNVCAVSSSGYSSDSVPLVPGATPTPVMAMGRPPWSSTDSSFHSGSSTEMSHLPPATHLRLPFFQKAGSFAGTGTTGFHHHPSTPRRSNTDANKHPEMSSPCSSTFRQPSIPEGSIFINASPSAVPAQNIIQGQTQHPVIFAVTSLDQVPPGAVILTQPHQHQLAVPPAFVPQPQQFPAGYDINTIGQQMQSTMKLQSEVVAPVYPVPPPPQSQQIFVMPSQGTVNTVSPQASAAEKDTTDTSVTATDDVPASDPQGQPHATPPSPPQNKQS